MFLWNRHVSGGPFGAILWGFFLIGQLSSSNANLSQTTSRPVLPVLGMGWPSMEVCITCVSDVAELVGLFLYLPELRC